MSDQDVHLYRQLYSQLGKKLKLGTAIPTPRFESAPLGPGPRFESAPFGPGPRFESAPLGPGPRFESAPLGPGPRFESAPLAPGPRTVVSDSEEESGTVCELVRDDDFQFLYPFHEWWWPDPPEGYIDPNAYVLLSRMPATQCSSTGLMTKYEISCRDLYSTYRNVLLHCPKVEVDSSDLLAHDAEEDWNTEYSKALTDSEKPSSPSGEKPGFVKMTTNVGTIACENYVVAHGHDWISELKKTAEEGDSNSSECGDNEPLLNLSLDLSAESSTESVDSPQPSDSFFATLMSNNEWENFDLAHHDKKVSVSVKVGAVARVPVDPDPKWYDSEYLHTLAERNSWNPPFTTADIFGEQGMLSQRITGFIAAHHITFKITVSPKTFRKFQPAFDTAVGFRIGPFQFGEGVHAEQTLAGVSSSIPEVSTSTPAVSTSIPAVSSSIPAVSSSIAAVSSSTPAVSTSIPAVSTSIPAVSTSIPAVSTSIPAVSTSTPAVSTTIPAVSTTIPAVSTSTPAVSTSIPAVSTSIPAVSTSIPAESSSIPEKSSSLAGAPMNQPRVTAGWKHKARSETSTFEGESSADYPIIIGITVEKIIVECRDW